MSFESDLRGWADRTGQKMDQIVRQAVVLAASGIVLPWPVGNPDLWAANEGKERGDPGYAGQGYVGGRSRANWQFGVGSPNTTVTDEVDPNGGATIQKFVEGMAAQKAGGIFFVSNSLPYIRRLEYEGHSTQLPSGAVRITFAALPSQVEQFAKSIK